MMGSPVAGASAGHLVLVGLPGAGKTTVGRLVAARVGRPFLDFDAELERRHGQSVPELFASQGEPAFRSMEIALTDEVAQRPPMVLAPGGGWIMNPGVVDRLRPPARLVHLHIAPELAVERLRASGVERPVVRGARPLEALHRLWERRRERYATADWILDVENHEPQQVANAVVALAGDWLGGVG